MRFPEVVYGLITSLELYLSFSRCLYPRDLQGIQTRVIRESASWLREGEALGTEPRTSRQGVKHVNFRRSIAMNERSTTGLTYGDT